MFDFSGKEKLTEKTVLHYCCGEPSLLLLIELFQKISCNPCSLDNFLRVSHQYIPFIYVSSRKLVKQWEMNHFLVRVKLDADENFDVFSEFDEEKSQGLASKDSFSVLPGHFHHGHRNSSGSFQYTQRYSLPKTQTHKKFLEVFKSSRCSSFKEISDQSGTLQENKKNPEPDPLMSKDLTESDLLITSQMSAKSIKLPSCSIQRLVYYQKSNRGIILSPKEKMQPKSKGRKLGSMISSLRFSKKDFKPISGPSFYSEQERDKMILSLISQKYSTLTETIKDLIDMDIRPKYNHKRAEKISKTVMLMIKLINLIKLATSFKQDGVNFIESIDRIKEYRQLVRSLNILIVKMSNGQVIDQFFILWKNYKSFVIQLNFFGRFTSSLQAAVEELALMIYEDRTKNTQEKVISFQEVEGNKIDQLIRCQIDIKKLYYDLLCLKLSLQVNYRHRLRRTILNNQLNRGVGQKFISNILNEFSMKITNTQMSSLGTGNAPLIGVNKPVIIQGTKTPM